MHLCWFQLTRVRLESVLDLYWPQPVANRHRHTRSPAIYGLAPKCPLAIGNLRVGVIVADSCRTGSKRTYCLFRESGVRSLPTIRTRTWVFLAARGFWRNSRCNPGCLEYKQLKNNELEGAMGVSPSIAFFLSARNLFNYLFVTSSQDVGAREW